MKLDELKKLADAATPGPWHHDILKSLGPTVKAEITALGKTVAKTYPTGSYIQDAMFIAAANPQTIKQLIALIEMQQNVLRHHVIPFHDREGEYFDVLAAFNKLGGE